MTNAVHGQTAALIARIAQNLPPMSADIMQGWIDNPKGLKKFLSGMMPPEVSEHRWREEDGVIYFMLTHQVAVLKGMLFDDDVRITKIIEDEAAQRGLETPNVEIARLTRDTFTDEDLENMGLHSIVFLYGKSLFLRISRDGEGGFMNTGHTSSDRSWEHSCGFAFIVTQV